MAQATKAKRIKTAEMRIKKLYASLPDNQKKLYSALFENAAFMEITLSDLQEQINQEGCVETYNNGEHQSGSKQSAAVQAYNNTMKSYLSVMKQLSASLPAEVKKQTSVLADLMKQKAAG